MLWSRVFAAFYDSFMFRVEKKHLHARRARLLAGVRGKTLEVGVGTGVNFEHYREAKDDMILTGIEPSPYMIARAEKRKDVSLKADRIELHNVGCGDPEMAALIEEASLDTVVSTLVLCTVPEPEKALRNFYRWLKPGGRLLVLEHIRSKGRFGARLQDFFNPFWSKVAEGCQLNRPTDHLVREAGFHPLKEEHFRIGIPFWQAVYVKPTK